MTPGQIGVWVTSGVLGSAGTAAAPSTTNPIRSMGVVASGLGICQYSDALSAAGNQRICLGVTTAGGAQISIQNLGTASALPLSIVQNGVTATLATVVGPFVANDLACFQNTAGAIYDCGSGISGLTVTNHATAIGTGALGFSSAGPCAQGGFLVYAGATSDPTCSTTGTSNIVNINTTGSAAYLHVAGATPAALTKFEGRLYATVSQNSTFALGILENTSTGTSSETPLYLDGYSAIGDLMRWGMTVGPLTSCTSFTRTFNIEAINSGGVIATSLALARTGAVGLGGCPTTSVLITFGNSGGGIGTTGWYGAAGNLSTFTPAATGTPAYVGPTTGGTFATTATSPITLNATTGVVACATCLTSSSTLNLVVGTTTIGSGATTRILYDNAGVLGEYTISGSGTVVAMATGASISALTVTSSFTATGLVTSADLRDSGALSVIGRSANSSGVPADISCTAASDAVLRESGSVLGCGTVATAGIANNAITLAKLATQATNTVLGNATAGTAVPTALSMTSCSTASSAVVWTTNTGFGCNTSITAASIAVGGITGLGTGVATALAINVGSAGAFVTFNGAGGTPSSVTLTNGTGLPTTGLTGTLQAAQEPAHTGDVTNSAGSLALTIAANAVTLAKLATQATNTVLGNATSGTAVPTALAVGTCSTAASALIWTTNTGFGCNTSITAAAVPASGLTGATLAAGVTASSLTSLGTITSLTATTINAFTLGGTISGGGNNLNNIVIGNTTPLAGSFTTIAASSTITGTQALAANTSGDGAILTNTTAATAGNQRYSPRLRLTGQGWKTDATAASQTVDWTWEAIPSEGTANVINNKYLRSQINGGGYADIMTITDFGTGGANAGVSSFQFNSRSISTQFRLAVAGTGIGFHYADTSQYIFGSLTNIPVIFWTNSATKMTLSAAGGLQIGSATDPGVGGLQVNAKIFAPNLATTAGALAAAICWTVTTGEFQRDTNAGGCLVSAGRYKHDIETLKPALPTVMAIRPVSFVYNDNVGVAGSQVGFIAEEVARVEPRLVGFNPDGEAQSVRYMQLTSVLTKAIQELKADNDNLRAEIARVAAGR